MTPRGARAAWLALVVAAVAGVILATHQLGTTSKETALRSSWRSDRLRGDGVSPKETESPCLLLEPGEAECVYNATTMDYREPEDGGAVTRLAVAVLLRDHGGSGDCGRAVINFCDHWRVMGGNVSSLVFFFATSNCDERAADEARAGLAAAAHRGVRVVALGSESRRAVIPWIGAGDWMFGPGGHNAALFLSDEVCGSGRVWWCWVSFRSCCQTSQTCPMFTARCDYATARLSL